LWEAGEIDKKSQEELLIKKFSEELSRIRFNYG